jgi:hypothetical protein
MKTNILLLFILVCYTITACCQPPKKEQIILDFKNNMAVLKLFVIA